MSPLLRCGLRLAFGAVIVVVMVVASLWSYAEFEYHRARLMLGEASRIQVGDNESSVLAFVSHYGGFKWTPAPEPLKPRDEWLDKDEYDFKFKNRDSLESDYKYVLGITPFGPLGPPFLDGNETLRSFRERFPVSLRPLLGFRNWSTAVEVSIRRGRVQSIMARTLVEGRSQYLGHHWVLAERMPRSHMPSRA